MKKISSLILAILICSTIALAGCNPSDATAKPDYTPIPKSDEYKLAIPVFPSTIDPQNWVQAYFIQHQIFDGLYEPYLGNTSDMRPCLATGHTVSDDGLTYTFTLREGVKFHNGDPLTPEDVVFSYNRWRFNPPFSYTGQIIKDVYVGEQPNTVVIELTYISPSTITILGSISIGNKKLLEDIDPATENITTADKLVGTGAYKVESIEQDRKIVLVRNDDYFMYDICMNGHKAEIKKVTFTVISDPTSMMIAFNKGEINSVDSGYATKEDIEAAIEKQRAAEEANQPPPVRVSTVSIATRYGLFVNMNDPVVGAQNGTAEEQERALKIRTAIAMSLERERINQIMYNGLGGISTQLTNPFTEGYLPDYKQPKEDHEAAKAILRELGYKTESSDPVSEKLQITITYPTDYMCQNLATAVQGQLSKSGIVVNMMGFERATWQQKAFTHDFQITACDFTPTTAVTYIAYNSPFNSTQSYNYSGYANPRVDQLLSEAAAELNDEIRVAKYTEINKTVHDSLCYIPCINSVLITMVNTYWYGIYGDPTIGAYKIYRLFWEDDGIWSEEDGFPYLNGKLDYLDD